MDCYAPRLPCDATQIGRFRRALGEAGFLISTFGLSLPTPGSPGHRGKYMSLTKLQLKWLNRCHAIEPLIGHAKADQGMPRCWLKGALGGR